MTDQSTATRPAAPSVAGGGGGAGDGPGGAAPPVVAGSGTGNPAAAAAGTPPAPEAAANNSSAPLPSGAAPRWPASAFFRWEDGAGPRDAWDALPFPPGGPGVLGRLRAAATGSKLFRDGRPGGGEDRTFSLSAELNLGGLSHLVPLKEDEDVLKAIQLWLPPPGAGGGMAIAVCREEGGASNAAAPRSVCGAAGSWPPSHSLRRDPLPRSAPAVSLGNAFPVDAWTCVINAVASSRCGGDSVRVRAVS